MQNKKRTVKKNITILSLLQGDQRAGKYIIVIIIKYYKIQLHLL